MKTNKQELLQVKAYRIINSGLSLIYIAFFIVVFINGYHPSSTVLNGFCAVLPISLIMNILSDKYLGNVQEDLEFETEYEESLSSDEDDE